VQKSALRDAILANLRQELALQASAAATSRDEAISEESRPENKWDTHSQEAAYLAEGQAKLVAEISASIELYASLALPAFTSADAIALGALVALEPASGGRAIWHFIGPRAGGMELSIADRTVLVLTPQSPLGRQLISKRVGDTATAAGRGASVTMRIVAVE
jgi:transcription elongation GreA/GreB family factor